MNAKELIKELRGHNDSTEVLVSEQGIIRKIDSISVASITAPDFSEKTDIILIKCEKSN